MSDAKQPKQLTPLTPAQADRVYLLMGGIGEVFVHGKASRAEGAMACATIFIRIAREAGTSREDLLEWVGNTFDRDAESAYEREVKEGAP